MLKIIKSFLLGNLFLFLCSLNTTITAAVTPFPITDPPLEKTADATNDVLTNKIYPAIGSTQRAVQKQEQILQQGLTGISGVGSIFSTPQEQSFRNWTPTTEDLTNMIKDGLQTGSLTDQIKYYNQKFPIPSMNQLTPGNANSIVEQYGFFSAVNTNMALSIADKSFDNIQKIMSQITYLYTLIDHQLTLKQGLDLNSAILVKIATLQTELIRLQSQQLKLQAVAQQQGNGTRIALAQFVENLK